MSGKNYKQDSERGKCAQSTETEEWIDKEARVDRRMMDGGWMDISYYYYTLTAHKSKGMLKHSELGPNAWMDG